MYRRRWWLFLAVLAVLCVFWPSWVWAQEGGCKDMRINAKGTSGAPITVSTAVVPIVDANTSRCRLMLTNESANAVRCAETTGKYTLTPSATVGMPLAANTTLYLTSFASQQAWSCTRVSADGVVTVVEELP